MTLDRLDKSPGAIASGASVKILESIVIIECFDMGDLGSGPSLDKDDNRQPTAANRRF